MSEKTLPIIEYQGKQYMYDTITETAYSESGTPCHASREWTISNCEIVGQTTCLFEWQAGNAIS